MHASRSGQIAAIAAFALIASCGRDRSPLAPDLETADGSATKVRRGLHVEASTADVVLMVRTPSAEPGSRGGTSIDLSATVYNPEGHALEHKRHVLWSSTDAGVATVDADGVVTAQGVGKCFVVVTHKKGTDSVEVEVIPVPVASVIVAGPDSISIGDVEPYVATPLDTAGEALEGRDVEWESETPAVASVSTTGSVAALTLGTTNIVATIDGTSGSRSVRVWPALVATVQVFPGTVSVPQFHKVQFNATAYDRHGNVLTGRPISWSSSAPATFYIKANADTAAGKDLGQAVVTATVEGKTGTSAVTVINPVEARALWVTRFEYTLASAVEPGKIATIFAKAAAANFNIVYFQVRTSGDALYFSDIEPCSPRMCGSLGGPRPASDPLDVALTEAAKYGIEVHAWLNAYTGFISGSTAACNQFINSTPMNWLKANPQWSVSTKNFTTGVLTRQVDNCLTSSEYMWVSPGVPEVRARLARVSADIARRYGPKGLKGIHLDRIRFPSNQVSYDPATQEAFRTATGAYPTSNAQGSWLNFRRGLVNQGVKDVFDSVAAVNPAIVLSAAVFPGYMPRAGWSAQWSYTDLFQDPQAWAAGGYLDIEVPMNYPATATSTSWTVKAYCSNTDWTCVLDDHIQRIEKNSSRQVYVGVAGIKGWAEINLQLSLAHDRTATGVSVYSYSQLDAAACGNCWTQLAAGPFKYKATIPAMPWKSAMMVTSRD